jgi:hypothetical protein
MELDQRAIPVVAGADILSSSHYYKGGCNYIACRICRKSSKTKSGNMRIDHADLFFIELSSQVSILLQHYFNITSMLLQYHFDITLISP